MVPAEDEQKMASLRIELLMPFIESTKETFSTMLATEIRRKAVSIKQGFDMFGDVSAVIGLSGPTAGTCAISMPQDFAERLMRQMLMVPEGEEIAESDIHDGVGELINMIAGGAKTKLSQTQHKFNITLPTIISGGPHEVFHRGDAHCVVVHFHTQEGDELALDVCVSQK